MPPETWFVLTLTVAALGLSLGIACSLVAWFAFKRRQHRLEQDVARRFAELTRRSQALEARLERFEEIGANAPGGGDLAPSQTSRPRSTGPSWPTADTRRRRDPAATRVDGGEPPLIAVPNLAAAANDRDVVVNGLTQRYAAIWSLAASGSSAEVIARATGQPIGQIELILGLRRQIDGTRTTASHAPHS